MSSSATGNTELGIALDGEDEPQMKRMDSMSSPAFSLKSTGDSAGTFPVVVAGTNDVASPIRADQPSSASYLPFGPSITPRLGKYTELILSLLSRPAEGEHSIPTEVANDLCEDVLQVFKGEQALLRIDVAEDENIVVVGDIHGQLSDLRANVFRLEPDSKRKFLFLGDYVDRGPNSVEVICLLFALKVEFPNRIHLLRGNHEESQTSRIYGFLYEVRTKFGVIDLWTKFNETFCWLPLAACVTSGEHRFMCVHGGLSPPLAELSQLNDIERYDYGGTLDTDSSDIVDGLLWSDPTDATSRFARNERGCGYLFGAATTSEFCEANQLDFICRAHQISMEGYCWSHGGRCLTVFSAPNYCGVNNNLAAILIVDGKWNLKFVQYDASAGTNDEAPSSPGKPPQYFA